MSNKVDKRIVEMQFDNKQFEKGIQTSVKSLEELKENLDLKKSAKGLSALEKAGKSFSLAGISEGVETISSRFSALGIIGVTALQRITNAAMDCGKRIVSAFAIDPVKMGFAEYETQINAVQTIVANTSDEMNKAGYSQVQWLDIVNEKLDELNAYADKTIYNFSEMTRNIGTFTAAGVDLETSVTSIQGIANLAAVSGSTSQQASTAMYQISQALASGHVNLMDWNSIVNAGMGGELFQKALMRTAEVEGVVGDEAQEAFRKLQSGEISFRDSLSSGWLSSDILTKTLSQIAYDFEAIAEAQGISVDQAKEMVKAELIAEGYTSEQADEIISLAETATDAATKVKTFTQLFDTLKEAVQSGWTQTWEYIIGDFEEAKELLTSISDYFGEIIGASADARNQVVSEWKNLGGRDQLIEGFWNIVHAIENVVKAFKGSFEEFFPPTTGQQLFNITRGFNEFAKKLKSFTENTEVMDKVRRVFKGVAAALDLVKTGIGWVWSGFKRILGIVPTAGNGLLNLAAKIGDFFVNLRNSVKSSELLQNVLTNLGKAVDSVRGLFVSAFRKIVKVFSDLIGKVRESNILTKIGENVNGFLSKIPAGVAKVREWGRSIIEYVKNSEALKTAYENVKGFFKPMIDGILEFGRKLKDTLKHVFDKDSDEGLFEQPKKLFEGFGEGFSGWLQSVKTSISENWGKVKEFVSNFFTQTIPNFFNSSKFNTSKIVDRIKSIDWAKIIKTAIGIYAGIKVLSSLGGLKSIGGGLKKIGKSLSYVGDGIKNVAKNGLKITKQEKDSIGNTLLKIAAAIGVLVASIWVLSKMDTKDVVKGLGVITILAVELLAVSILFSKVGANGKSFFAVAAAVTLLVIPIKLLASMKTEEAVKGIIAIGAILTELALFMRLAGKGFQGKSPFLSLSIGVNLLVLAVKGLAKMSVGGLVKGLAGMEVLLLELSAFMKKAGSVGKVGGMLMMALAINLMVRAVKKMGNMKLSTIAKGVAGLGSMMLAFGTMVKLTGGMKLGDSLLMLLSLAGTLILFIEAFKQVEGMDTDSMLKFSLSLSATMLALSVSMKIISSIPFRGALTGLASFAILIVGIGGIIAALGWLQSKWGNMSSFLDSGGEVLGQIGTAIGKFVGGIVGGFVQGLDLPQIGQDLSDFMTNASGFISGAKKIDGTAVAGVGYLAAAIIAIGAAEVVNAILTLFGGENPIVAFSGQLKLLGEGLIGYAESIKGFSSEASSEDINSSVETAKSLALLNSSLPATGGRLQDWLGTKDLSLFATQIEGLAEGLKKYAASIKGFSSEASEDDLKTASSTAQGLADLNNSLPYSGGKLQEWLGKKDLSLFSTQIVELAGGLKSYLETVKGFSGIATEDDLTIATDTATGLSDLNNSLPYSGGKLQEWLGKKDLSLFSTQIVELAGGLKSYLETVKGFSGIASPEDLSTASDTAMGLSDLNNSLPYTGGTLSNWLMGEKNLATFATRIRQLGSGLRAYANSISGFSGMVSEADLESAKQTAMALVTLNNSLPSTDSTLSKWLFGEKDLGKFGVNIGLLGSCLGEFAENISVVSVDKSGEAINVLDMIKDFIDKLDPKGGIWQSLDSFVNGDQIKALTSYTGTMRTIGLDLSTFATKIADVKTTDIEYASTVFDSVSTFISGLTESGGVLESIGSFFTGDKSSTLTKASATMATFGNDFKAFADGIANVTTTETNFEGAKRVFESFKTFNETVAGYDEINYSDQMSDLIWILGDFGTSLAQFGVNLTGVDVNSLSAAASVIDTLVRLAGDAEGVNPDNVAVMSSVLDEYGKMTVSGFSSGFLSGTEGITEAVSGILLSISGRNEEFLSTGTDLGTTLADALGKALDDKAWSIETKARTLSYKGAASASGTYMTWYYAGQNLAIGLGDGISSKSDFISRKAIEAASGAVRSVQRVWDEHSPSKVGYGLGAYFDLGIAEGLDGYAKIVSSSAENMSQGAMASAQIMLADLSNLLASGVDATPTIRPVLDLSDIQNGVGLIDGMFNSDRSIGMSMFGGGSFLRGAGALNFDGAKIIGGMSNKDVVEEIQNLNDRMTDLTEAVGNMQLVLDTGTLVGQTSAKMDRQLGTIATRKGRGN